MEAIDNYLKTLKAQQSLKELEQAYGNIKKEINDTPDFPFDAAKRITSAYFNKRSLLAKRVSPPSAGQAIM